MRASFLRNTRPYAKRVDVSVDGVSDRGSTPLASTISESPATSGHTPVAGFSHLQIPPKPDLIHIPDRSLE
jgi:hypothetical protein